MKLIVNLIILLAVPVWPVEAIAGVSCQDFVLELAGYVIQRRLDSIEGTRLQANEPLSASTLIAIENVYAEARSEAGPYLRLLTFVRVTDATHPKTREANVAISADAALEIELGKNHILMLRIIAIPGTFRVTADNSSATWAEELVKRTSDSLAAKLTLDVPLEGLSAIAAARPPNNPPLRVLAYELGFGWVLQIFAPAAVSAASPARIYLTGNAFSMWISADTLRAVADLQYSAGNVPRTLGDDGLPNPQGPIHIEDIDVSLAKDIMKIEWIGRRSDSPVTVQWELGFVDTPGGLALDIKALNVDGRQVPAPKNMEPVNPIDELIKSVIFGPHGGKLLDSPLGQVKITTGWIQPDLIFIAGRA